jgi:hypothetical protein
LQPFQHKSFNQIFPIIGYSPVIRLSQDGASVQAVLEEVELEINRRFFDTSNLILSDSETKEWMCWENTRKKFSQILEHI